MENESKSRGNLIRARSSLAAPCRRRDRQNSRGASAAGPTRRTISERAKQEQQQKDQKRQTEFGGGFRARRDPPGRSRYHATFTPP